MGPSASSSCWASPCAAGSCVSYFTAGWGPGSPCAVQAELGRRALCAEHVGLWAQWACCSKLWRCCCCSTPCIHSYLLCSCLWTEGLTLKTQRRGAMALGKHRTAKDQHPASLFLLISIWKPEWSSSGTRGQWISCAIGAAQPCLDVVGYCCCKLIKKNILQ